jgi:hypothetical protein
MQEIQGPPEPGIRPPSRTKQPPDHPEHTITNHQSHQVYGTDADPWAIRDQRRVDEAERWGETVGMVEATYGADASTSLRRKCLLV